MIRGEPREATPRSGAPQMGFYKEDHRRPNRHGRQVQRRLWNRLRKLIGRKQAIARRLKQIDSVQAESGQTGR